MARPAPLDVNLQDRDQPQVIFTRQLWQRDAPDDDDPNFDSATAVSASTSAAAATAAGPVSPSRSRGSRRLSTNARATRIARIDSVVPTTAMGSPTLKSPLTTADFDRLAIVGSPRKRTHDVDYFSALLATSADIFIPFCSCQKIPRPRNAFILYRQHYHALITEQEMSLTNPEISKLVGEKWRSEPQQVRNEWMLKAQLEKREHARKYPDYRYQPRRGPKERGPTCVVICQVCHGRKIAPMSTPTTPQVENGPEIMEGGPATSRRSNDIATPSPMMAQPAMMQLPFHPLAPLDDISTPLPQYNTYNKRQRIEHQVELPAPLTAPITGGFQYRAESNTTLSTQSDAGYDRRASAPNSTAANPPSVDTDPGPSALPSISSIITSPLGPAPVKLAPMMQHVPETQIMTNGMRRLQHKVRLFQGTLRSAGRPSPHARRAPIVAVEGDSVQTARDVGEWLGEMFDDAGTNVMTSQGPRPPEKRKVGREDLHNMAATWLQRSGDIYRQAVAFASQVSDVSSARSSRANTVTTDGCGDSSHPSGRGMFPTGDDAHAADSEDDMSHTAMILFRSYLLGASELFAQHLRRIPGVPDEDTLWQYMAEEWRGVIAPDLLIYIKDVGDEDEADLASVAHFDGGNVLIIRGRMPPTASGRLFAGIRKDALLRLKLDVQLWLKAFYRAQRRQAR